MPLETKCSYNNQYRWVTAASIAARTCGSSVTSSATVKRLVTVMPVKTRILFSFVPTAPERLLSPVSGLLTPHIPEGYKAKPCLVRMGSEVFEIFGARKTLNRDDRQS